MRLAAQTNIVNGLYADTALSWAAMRAVNWLPEIAEAEGTRTLKKYATPPGLRLLVDLGTSAPVRGLEDVEGRLFAVSGDSLFEVTNDLSAINRGSIPGVGRVSMAHNQQGGASAANELAIANGLSGYVYNTDTTVLAQITDDAFEGASTFDYVDGYMSYTDPQGRWWGHSDLNQATQYSSLDRNDAESAPDKIVSHLVSHREVIVWGTRTGEFFRNTGAATGTFQRVDGTEMEVGICATFARARVDNTVCWVGNDLTVYRLNGHAPQRISTRPIEQLLASVDPTTIFCFTWEDRGHKVFYVTSPNNFTVGFDFASGLWHARESYGLAQWRINALVRWGNRWVAGDYVNGFLYELDWDVYTENGRPMVSQCATGYTWAEQNKLLCPYAELIFDTGGGLGTVPDELSISGDLPPGTVGDPIAAFSYSAAGGYLPYTFSLLSGALPTGASLSSDGSVTGTYSAAGSFSWTVRVTDNAGNTADLADSAVVVSGNITLTALTTVAPALGTVVAWSPDSIYCAITSFTSPYVHVYKRTGDTFAALSLPALGMSSRGQGLRWSADGLELAVAPEATTDPFVLRRSGDTFTKATLGDQQPLTQERGLTYSPDGTQLGLTYSNKLYAWAVSGGVYTPSGAKATFSADSQVMQASDYSSDGELFATGLAASPWIDVFSISGGTFSLISPPPSVPAAISYQPRFSPDALFLGWCANVSPFYALYSRNPDTNAFTAIGSLPVAAANSVCFEWSPTGANFAVGGTGVDMRVMKRNGTTVTFLTSPASTSTTAAIGWSPNASYLAAAHNGGVTFFKVT